jgi:Bacterial regulatory proteins, luxR family
MEISRMTASLLMFAVHAQDATMRILLADVLADDEPRLTQRELETLRWTIEGKTAWEIGRLEHRRGHVYPSCLQPQL